MNTPSSSLTWARFARLHYDLTVDSVVIALGLEIPPEGRPRTFVAGHHPEHGYFQVTASDNPGSWLLNKGSESYYRDTKAVLTAANNRYLSKGTATGDALRRWMALWEPPTGS